MAKNTYANDRRHGGRRETQWREAGDIEVFDIRPAPVIDHSRHSKEWFVGYAPYIDRLIEVAQLGYSILYPVAEHKPIKQQWTSLHLAARSRGIKVKVHKVDDLKLQVTLIETDDKDHRHLISWRRYFNEEDIVLVPTDATTSFIHDDDHLGYAPFIDKLIECGPQGYGVVYKLRETCFGCTEALQRAGLYTAARRRKVWISIAKRGEHELLVYWKGSDPYASEHHKGVRRQHVRDDDESVAARFARAADWDYRT